MRIQSIQLKHTTHFSDLKVDLSQTDAGIHLIVGEQGAGKTAVLRAMHQALSWFAARHKEPRTTGMVMPDHDIMWSRLQSKIDICVKYPSEIAALNEPAHQNGQEPDLCQWQMYKTLNAQGTGVSKIEAAQLDRLIQLYHLAQKQDPFIGSPFIAYYPAERFIHEIPLLNKHNPLTFQLASAYDITSLPFTTFSKFFEWLREISDIENAATAESVKKILAQPRGQVSDTLFNQQLTQAYYQVRHPHLTALQHALRTVFPELEELTLNYHPKLQLMAVYKGKSVLFQQLPGSLRVQVALVGDIVRRLCILNPKSPEPCQEGEGILLIDAIDQYLDIASAAMFLNGLHRAFPHLQIICTSQHAELVEESENWHCLRLINQQIYPISPQHSSEIWQAFYAQLQHQHDVEQLAPEIHENIASTDDINTCIQHLQQQFNPQQLDDLQQRLAALSQPISIDPSK